jgi:hypothetical protein
MTAVNSVGTPSAPTRAPLLQAMQAEEKAALNSSKTLGGSAATSSAADYQTALNVFGNAVTDSFKGENFGPKDMDRFKAAIEDKLKDPNLTQGQKDALKKIAVEFEASNDLQGSAFDSADWAKSLGNIGKLLKTVPGAEKIGDSLVNLSGLIERSYNPDDGKFGADDIGKLQRRSGVWRDSSSGDVADLAERLIKGGRPEDGGNVINAANFGSLLSGLSLGTPAAAAASVATAPQPAAAEPSAARDLEQNYFNIAIDSATFNSFPADWAKTLVSPTLDMAAAWAPEEKAAN